MIQTCSRAYETRDVVFPRSGQNAIAELKTAQNLTWTATTQIFSIETSIQMELSLVNEVEAVVIDRESDSVYKVISVVNERDAGIREKVYRREEAIMEMYPFINFDFHVLARMNRKLEDVMTRAKKVVFKR